MRDEIDEKIHGEPGGLGKYWPEWMKSVTVHEKGYAYRHTNMHFLKEILYKLYSYP